MQLGIQEADVRSQGWSLSFPGQRPAQGSRISVSCMRQFHTYFSAWILRTVCAYFLSGSSCWKYRVKFFSWPAAVLSDSFLLISSSSFFTAFIFCRDVSLHRICPVSAGLSIWKFCGQLRFLFSFWSVSQKPEQTGSGGICPHFVYWSFNNGSGSVQKCTRFLNGKIESIWICFTSLQTLSTTERTMFLEGDQSFSVWTITVFTAGRKESSRPVAKLSAMDQAFTKYSSEVYIGLKWKKQQPAKLRK